MTMPARIEVLDRVNQKTLLKVIIKESRNRQIRKIGTLLGNPVQDLQRISISNTNSNGLQQGKWLKKRNGFQLLIKNIFVLWH